MASGQYQRTSETTAWMSLPWVCPKCQVTLRASGKGTHLRWCGKSKERFWERVNKTDSCWLFTGTISWEGYGRFNEMGCKKQHQAHRYAWLSLGKEIPEGKALLHRCDVRHCVNPDHLYVGDWRDNAADKLRRGRDPTACLNADQVREARKLLKTMTQRAVAKILGVKPGVINELANGHTYGWVTDGNESHSHQQGN